MIVYFLAAIFLYIALFPLGKEIITINYLMETRLVDY